MIQLVPDGVAKRTRSPFGFQLIDVFTGEGPLGRLTPHLDLRVGTTWVPTAETGWISSTWVLAYPGLGRQADASQPPRTYRLRIGAELYRPHYLHLHDGITVTVPPYNDTEPTGPFEPAFGRIHLIPATLYQFPAYVPVLRGEVVDSAGTPVANAEVTNGTTPERGLTDERGAFCMPLRQIKSATWHWNPSPPPDEITYQVTAKDRAGHTGTISITLDDVLAGGVLISIS